MLSGKDKDTWIKDYFNLIKIFPHEEIRNLETTWANEKSKKEYYFRTDDEIEKLDLWLIDTVNYQNLTVEMKALIRIVPKENGCKIDVKIEKFRLFYLKAVIWFFALFIFLFCSISQSMVPMIFGLFFVIFFHIQKRIIYKKTKGKLIQKLEEVNE